MSDSRSGFEFRVQGSEGSGFRVQGLELRVPKRPSLRSYGLGPLSLGFEGFRLVKDDDPTQP